MNAGSVGVFFVGCLCDQPLGALNRRMVDASPAECNMPPGIRHTLATMGRCKNLASMFACSSLRPCVVPRDVLRYRQNKSSGAAGIHVHALHLSAVAVVAFQSRCMLVRLAFAVQKVYCILVAAVTTSGAAGLGTTSRTSVARLRASGCFFLVKSV